MEEVWKDIEGYEGLYKVSNKGRIYSIEKGKPFSYGVRSCNNYYCYATLVKNGIRTNHSIHRLVANAFIPNPNNFKIVHHIDGNKKNNCIENLQWCTQKENVAHCIANGNFGTMNRSRRYTKIER